MNQEPADQEAAFFIFPEEPAETPPSAPVELPAAPPWRRFEGGPLIQWQPQPEPRGAGYQRSRPTALRVNVALTLRRPLLVTGSPGTGKTTLALALAHELGLGPLLRWNITSRTTLKDGLYSYDALGRLNEASLARAAAEDKSSYQVPPLGRFIRLGPLGTALLPSLRPRVLLIDELDKSDVDLPNDLLHVFEEGEYEIPELMREAGKHAEPEEVRPEEVRAADGRTLVSISGGKVRCSAFPIVVITSNLEREFSPAFMRRCIPLHLPEPGEGLLARIAGTKLASTPETERKALIDRFLQLPPQDLRATDQLLNALFLLAGEERTGLSAEDRNAIFSAATTSLGSSSETPG